ncbi:LacI family DNA-binding transcriptional regulator [Dictyobacter aurantiacus]|uniref:LacI family transcriptional regulator n=1 Tax=Dictyobacter aurantiacus TaxID=1936993 RepID=A0A401ZI63_9CHLR|nr:LacI family DNA-binding transcriptional regulator [Dictyobacter aurantiacus]GCE06534.1 LacI family transcriptional regulator [Dictyobacter aurantiacus]
MARKRTIDDIARLAGVSKTTVSRVLNNKPDVDPNTRERILRIVKEEGFVPSATAAGLAGGRSHLLGVLVPSFTWPMIPDIVCGIAETIGNTAYELVLYSLNDKTRENGEGDIIDHILSTNLVAGILAVLPGQSSKFVIRLHQHGFPVVLIDDQDDPPLVPWIGADNQCGAYDAVKHLLALGHRRIAHIQGPMKYVCSRERYEGYCQALREHGIPVEPTLVIEGAFDTASGRDAAQTLLSLPEDQRPTAIFAGSDLMAYGVLAFAEEQGIDIPGELALVGFDAIGSSALVRPALTTVKQPFQEMGQRGIEVLLSIIEQSDQQRFNVRSGYARDFMRLSRANVDEPANAPPLRIRLATSLVVRASCGMRQRSPFSSIKSVSR